MAAPQTSSRLQLLQARFQQKQLQEKEQKLLQLYDQQQQRAHQVAQRGSAGSNSSSNGSSHSVVIAATKVQRQSFERLHSNAKGIDKSYPLEPLRKPAPGCPLGRSVSKAGQTSSSHRSVVVAKQQQQQQQQRTSRADVSRSLSQRDPSYGPSRGGQYNGHSSLGASRESCSSSRDDYAQPPESIRKVNGHATNGRHYEINIDEVIDDAAMERNRMLAKYEARRFSGPDLVGLPGDEPAADGAARKPSPQTEQPERSGAAGSRKPAVTSRRTVPTGGNAIRSTIRDYDARDAKQLPESIVKNVAPYPSPKSPSTDVPERKSRPVAKSTSMKFLSRIVGSNGDVSSANENGFTAAGRNSSVDTLDSPTDSRGRSVNEQKTTNAVQKNGLLVPVTPTPRTGPVQQLSNVESQSSTGSRGQVGTRAGSTKSKAPTPPTPAHRTSIDNSHNDDSLRTCKICSRRFHSERINKHEQICAKTAQKKRKQFDALTHRVKGTDLESFVQKPMGKKQVQKNVKPEVKTSNWRRKHEDFINAIRSAKQMQEHLAAGGKLSELPPPPRSDTSDYVQCPHCSRKFSKGAAERHVPKCETMMHNKPPRVQLRTSVKY